MEIFPGDIVPDQSSAFHMIEHFSALRPDNSTLAARAIAMDKGENRDFISFRIVDHIGQPLQGNVHNRPARFKIERFMDESSSFRERSLLLDVAAKRAPPPHGLSLIPADMA
jgi:hypothetical protein